MAVNYDEKILSTFGKRNVRLNEPENLSKGIFVVDPNKIVTEDETIIPRYVKQEDLVMYANITARLNPDSAIIDDGTDNSKVITIGRVGVNFLNPLAKSPKDNLGNVVFGDKKNKDYFTTEWSDYFTSNAEQGSFFDPETFGISNIDVTHNASLTPIIKIEFIDVQGRTLLERGDDPTNPYNIFYRFPYPLFTLTIKGYFGKAIEYPLSMTKTSTTFDSSTGNYVIRAEFLSRTFSIYNNFLMIYAYVAPYMYERTDVPKSYLGKRLLTALYQKQNAKYAEIYGTGTTEYLKHEFVKYPSLLDLSLAQSALGYETLSIESQIKEINVEREKSLLFSGQLDTAYTSGIDAQYKDYWETILLKNNNDKFFLRQDTIDRLKSDEITLSFTDFPEPSYMLSDYLTQLTVMNEGDGAVSVELKSAIYDDILNSADLPDGYKSSIVKDDLKSLIREELILMYNTSSNDDSELAKVYYTKVYFDILHKTITKTINSFYDKEENRVIDELGFKLKGNLGYVPNMSNVIRILMNNMQIFLTMLNLVALNAAKQLNDDPDRKSNQSKFGEYEVDNNSPELKRFFPFPNYFHKKFDTDSDEFVWEKIYPYTTKTINWFEVQFVEEIYKAMDRLKALDRKLDSQTEADVLFQLEQAKKVKTDILGEKRMALLTTLLVVNNLNYYDDQQNPRETCLEFIEKVLLFSTLGFINTAGDTTKISDITRLFVDHEFDLIDRRYQNKEPNDLHFFYSNMSIFIGGVGVPSDETPTNYDKVCYELVNGRSIDTSDNTTFDVTTNNIAVVNNINNLLPEFKALLATNYTVDQLRSLYSKIDAIINSATDINEFKKLYQYNPLRYKNRKNPDSGQTVNALFFDGLDAHDQYDGVSDHLNKYAAKLNEYKKTGLVSANNGYFYTLNTEKGDQLNFTVDSKVEANDPNSTALTFALKTDGLLKATNYVGGINLDSSKKITSGTKYSKVRI
jgi:hypothetical protein